MTSGIVVGVDGSAPSLVALRWSVAETRIRRDAELSVVIVHPPALDWPHDSADHVATLRRHIADRVREVRRLADAALGEALAAVTPGGGGPPLVSTHVVEGHPTAALLAASRGAELLVVGGRGHGGWHGALSGSVTAQLAGHTSVPLVVARALPDRLNGQIVVGVDGPGSTAAVRFAFDEAVRRGAAVTVTTAWQYPVLGTHHTSPETAALLERGARAALEQALADAADAHPTVPCTTSVLAGHPVDVLVDAAAGADLVVVGSRGRGGFRSLLLGSVAIGVLHRVAGPIVVVPHG